MGRTYGKSKAKSVNVRSITSKGILVKELEKLGVREIEGQPLLEIKEHVLATKLAILREVM